MGLGFLQVWWLNEEISFLAVALSLGSFIQKGRQIDKTKVSKTAALKLSIQRDGHQQNQVSSWVEIKCYLLAAPLFWKRERIATRRVVLYDPKQSEHTFLVSETPISLMWAQE